MQTGSPHLGCCCAAAAAAAAVAVAVAASQAAGTETAVLSSLLAGSRVGSQFLSVAGDSVVDSTTSLVVC